MPDFVIGDISVPDVVGDTELEATTALEDNYLLSSAVDQSDAFVAVGLIISQSPVSGSAVPAGSVVTIYVSTGIALGAGDGVGNSQGRAVVLGVGFTFGSRGFAKGLGTALGVSDSDVPMGAPEVSRVVTERIVLPGGF